MIIHIFYFNQYILEHVHLMCIYIKSTITSYYTYIVNT